MNDNGDGDKLLWLWIAIAVIAFIGMIVGLAYLLRDRRQPQQSLAQKTYSSRQEGETV
jgi:hypothetical protein